MLNYFICRGRVRKVQKLSNRTKKKRRVNSQNDTNGQSESAHMDNGGVSTMNINVTQTSNTHSTGASTLQNFMSMPSPSLQNSQPLQLQNSQPDAVSRRYADLIPLLPFTQRHGRTI